jgi:hypothetical protein
VGEPEGKRPLGRYMKIDLGKIRWGGVDWIGLAKDRDQWWALVNAVINPRVSYNAEEFLSGCTSLE